MTNILAGKVAIVTGGNSGIGKATALMFAAEGATTIVTARRLEEGEATVAEIHAAGGAGQLRSGRCFQGCRCSGAD